MQYDIISAVDDGEDYVNWQPQTATSRRRHLRFTWPWDCLSGFVQHSIYSRNWHEWSACTSGVRPPAECVYHTTNGVCQPAECVHQRSTCTSGVHAPAECMHHRSASTFQVDPFLSSGYNQSRRMSPHWCYLKWTHFHHLSAISLAECSLVGAIWSGSISIVCSQSVIQNAPSLLGYL